MIAIGCCIGRHAAARGEQLPGKCQFLIGECKLWLDDCRGEGGGLELIGPVMFALYRRWAW
jgi:hypothetical protein